MAAEQVPIESRENPREAMPAAGEEDRFEVRVGREAMERGEALLVAAGQKPLAGQDIVGEDRLEAEAAQGFQAAFQLGRVDRPGKSGHTHAVARAARRREFGGRDQEAGELRKPNSVSPAEAG